MCLPFYAVLRTKRRPTVGVTWRLYPELRRASTKFYKGIVRACLADKTRLGLSQTLSETSHCDCCQQTDVPPIYIYVYRYFTSRGSGAPVVWWRPNAQSTAGSDAKRSMSVDGTWVGLFYETLRFINTLKLVPETFLKLLLKRVTRGASERRGWASRGKENRGQRAGRGARGREGARAIGRGVSD